MKTILKQGLTASLFMLALGLLGYVIMRIRYPYMKIGNVKVRRVH